MAVYARGNPARWWKSRSCGGASRSPRLLFVSPVRRWSSRTALLFFLMLFVGVWYVTNPARISRLSEVLLSRVLGGQVKVGTGHLSFSGTLLLNDVRVGTADVEPRPGDDVPVFSAEQIEVRFDWLSLLTGHLSATQLVAVTPVFRPIENRDTGHWNFERLRAANEKRVTRGAGVGAMSLPVVVLKNARVQWGEVVKGKVEQTAETVMDGQLVPEAGEGSTYHFQFVQMASPGLDAAPAFGASTMASKARADVGLVLTGTWDVGRSQFSMNTDNLVLSEALKSGLPRQVREFCEEHHVAGRLSQVNLTFNPRDGLGMSVVFDGAADGVSMVWMVEPEQGIGVGEERPAYPLDVKNVRGRVLFTQKAGVGDGGARGAGMRFIDLRGKVLGYEFVANCDVDGPTFDSPFELKLEFPKAMLRDPYPPLFTAFLTSQDLMQRIAPHGQMDIGVVMKRTVEHGSLQFSGTIDCHDTLLRFAHFPFPLDHVNGLITFDQDSVTFHDVVAKADDNDVKIKGSAGTNWGSRYIDFTITSDNVTFDDRIKACLADQHRAIWDLFSLDVHGSLVCTVTRSNALWDQPKVVVDVKLDGGKGYIHGMPYPFSNATGRIHFEAEQTRLENVRLKTGAEGDGVLVLNGLVRHAGNDVANLQPELTVQADVPVDGALIKALPEEISEKLAGVSLGGRMMFDGTVRRESALQVAGEVKWKGGMLKTVVGADDKQAGQAVEVTGIEAAAAMSPEMVELKRFAGDVVLPGAERVAVELGGKIFPGTMRAELNGSSRGTGITLPAEAPVLFPKQIADMWRSYSPAGKLDLNLTAAVRVGGGGTGTPALELTPTVIVDRYDVTIMPRNVSLKKADWPAEVKNLNGQVHTAAAGDAAVVVQMRDMAAISDGVLLTWEGDVVPATGAVTLSGKALADAWPQGWVKKLPEGVVKNLDLKRAGLGLSAQVNTLTRAASDRPWTFDGSLETKNIGVTGPMVISAQRATLVGKGTFDAKKADAAGGGIGGMEFVGSLAATELKVTNRPIESLTANVNIAGAAHEIAISEIQGNVAGGRLRGTIQFHTPGETAGTAVAGVAPTTTAPLSTMPADQLENGYTAEMTLTEAELSRLLLPAGATEEERKKVGTGRVTASLALKETFGEHGERTGRGDLDVRDGNIFDVPLSMGLMQIATLRLPVARSFQKATMSYYLRDNEVTFEKILLESQGINLAGLGTVSIKDKGLNLGFVTETPNEFFVPILSPLIQETRNGLLQVSVTGTIDDPKVTPVPLSAISNTLKALLARPRADNRR